MLYANSKFPEIEIKEEIPFIIVTKNKIPRKKFEQSVTNLYDENYKILKEIEDNTFNVHRLKE